VESGTRQHLSIRHWNQAHPAARDTPQDITCLQALLVAAGCPLGSVLPHQADSAKFVRVHLFEVVPKTFSNEPCLFSCWIYYKPASACSGLQPAAFDTFGRPNSTGFRTRWSWLSCRQEGYSSQRQRAEACPA